MSLQTLSYGAHDRFTPEFRDKVLEKLRTAMASVDETEYRLLSSAQLRALAEIDQPEGPVLSVYLQLGGDRRTGRNWNSFFNAIADATLRRIGDRRLRRLVKEEFDRIERTLDEGLPTMGRGVAFFVCRATGLWRQIALTVQLPDGAWLGRHPYIRPLARTRDEHDRFILAVLSQERTRYFISRIGQVEEVLQVKGDRLHMMLTDRVPRDRADVLATDAMKLEAHALGTIAEL